MSPADGNTAGKGTSNNKSWVKGMKSPNPGGRPKGKGLSGWLREVGLEIDPGQKMTNEERIARVVVREALQAEDWAIELYAERTEGKVKDVLQIERGSRMPGKSDADLAAKLSNKAKNEAAAAKEPRGKGA